MPLARAPRAARVRARLVSEALRPADTTDRWASFAAAARNPRATRGGARRGRAARRPQRAGGGAGDRPRHSRSPRRRDQRRSRVVTPDRNLARRVAVELGRWQLSVDDSAGAPLDGSAGGRIRPTARRGGDRGWRPGEPARAPQAPASRRSAWSRPDCRRAARTLELALFRGRRVNGGIAALAPALAQSRREAEENARHLSQARRRIPRRDWNLAETLVSRLSAILGPIEAALRGGRDGRPPH